LDDSAIKKTISRGVAWVGVATSVVAVLDLVALALILHLWVDAEQFGVVTAVITVFGTLQLIAELGIPAAIVQADDDEDRLATMFWLGIIAGVACYAIVFVVAPYAAAAHDHPEESKLFRVAGLLLLLRPIYMTHQSILRKHIRFKDLSLIRVIANTAEFVVKVGTAAAGLGVWCFILGPLAREIATAIGVPIAARWKPRWVCRPRLVGHDMRFAMRSTSGEILYQFYSNLDYQVVAYQFGAVALGQYRAAYELVLEPVRFVSAVVTVVAFPTFARLRHDRTAIANQFIAFTRQNLVVVLVMLAVIVVAADDALIVAIGPGYARAAGAARVLAIVGILRALSHLGQPFLDGIGRPDLTLRYQITATVALGSLFLAFAYVFHSQGTFSVAVAWAVGYPIAFALHCYMVFANLELRALAYLRRIIRIPILVGIGALAGIGTRLLVDGWQSPTLRLVAIGGTVIVVSFVLLGTFEQYSPRAIIRSLRA
jgi:teichuronic acid exporter